MPRFQGHFFHQGLHFKEMLLVQSAALSTLAVLNTLRGCQFGQDPLSQPLREPQSFQGLVSLQKAVKP